MKLYRSKHGNDLKNIDRFLYEDALSLSIFDLIDGLNCDTKCFSPEDNEIMYKATTTDNIFEQAIMDLINNENLSTDGWYKATDDEEDTTRCIKYKPI